MSNIAVGRLICRRKAARADSGLSKVFSCSNDLILSSRTLIRAAAYDKTNSPNQYDLKLQLTLHKQSLATRNTFHNGIPQYLYQRYTQNSHATTRCPYQYHTQTVTQQHVASPAVYASTTRCLHQWFTQNSQQQHVAFTGGIRRRVTQQHVAFSNGTRKNSHATTRCLHRWRTKNNHATTRCLHQWYTQKHAILTNGKRKTKHATTRCLHRWYTQNSHSTTRCLHQWYTQKTVTQQYVAFTGGTHKTVMQQHVAFTGGIRK